MIMMLLLVIGGAIVNVAVAWGCAVWLGRFATVWIDAPDTTATPAFVKRLVDDRNQEHAWSGWGRAAGIEPLDSTSTFFEYWEQKIITSRQLLLLSAGHRQVSGPLIPTT